MDWLFESPSSLWQWIGIFVGILAFVGFIVSIPTIFQMFWGRPLLKVDFENGVEGEKRFLAVHLKNPPVKNRILRKLGVRRDAIQSLTIQFRIREFGSGKIIDPIRHARIYSDDDPTDIGKDRIVLPPTSSVGASFMVVFWDTQNNKAFVPPDRLRQLFEIAPGYYQVFINLMVGGESMRAFQQFKVGEKADDLVWTKPN